MGFQDKKEEHQSHGGHQRPGDHMGGGEIPGRHPELSFMCFLQKLAASSEKKKKRN